MALRRYNLDRLSPAKRAEAEALIAEDLRAKRGVLRQRDRMRLRRQAERREDREAKARAIELGRKKVVLNHELLGFKTREAMLAGMEKIGGRPGKLLRMVYGNESLDKIVVMDFFDIGRGTLNIELRSAMGELARLNSPKDRNGGIKLIVRRLEQKLGRKLTEADIENSIEAFITERGAVR